MPTLECLDERTKLILDRISSMDAKVTKRFDEFDSAFNERLTRLEDDVDAIKLSSAREDGQKSVTLWVGGLVLAMLGAIGNMILVWLLGPKGPLGH